MGSDALLSRFFGAVVFFKQIVWRTLQNIAKSLQILELDTAGLIIHHFIEILIA